MGAQISSTAQLTDNELLRRFGGLEPITENDPFWNQLLSFNFRPPSNRIDGKFFDEATSDLLEALMYNTTTTNNFASLIGVFLRRAAELKTSTQCEDKLFIWHTGNALIILRYVCKFLAQRINAEELMKFFSFGNRQNENNEADVDEFLGSLVEILVDLPVNELTKRLHFESLSCLIALLSCELFSQQAWPSKFLQILMHGKCSIHAPLLVRVLLSNFINYDEHMEHLKPEYYNTGGSLILGLAASFASVLQWGYGDKEEEEGNDLSLSSQSLFALLLLSCHRDQMQDVQFDRPSFNPYRQALFAFHNSQEVSTLTSPTSSVATFKFDYNALYEKLCCKADQQPCLLLLYLLVHRNHGFRNFVLSRVNVEHLLFPILKVLYKNCLVSSDEKEEGVSEFGREGSSENGAGTVQTSCDSHHTYLALILLLIFSEDEFFCKVVHESLIGKIDWFSKLRVYTGLTLGGLIVLVLLKTIQHNTSKIKDRYLQTNCLAALANMSAHFKQLHPYVCQQLIGLLEQLCKKHSRLVESLELNNAKSSSETANQTNSDNLQNITAVEEAMRMLMEVVNSSLTSQLRHNPHLVYTMLHRRELFDSLHHHPMFHDLLWNITAVLNHFASRLSGLEKNASSSDIMGVVQQGALQWPTDRLKRFPELKFKYVEDANTDDFFVPYVWSLVFKLAGFHWDASRIKLFEAKLCNRNSEN